MIVVADTGPLNYLIRLGHIDLLNRLYKSVVIPAGVIGEMLHPRAPVSVRSWAIELPAWAESANVSLQDTNLPAGLGIGESEAIVLAERLSADLILMDEIRGRRTAVSRGLRVGGTLSALAIGSQLGLVDFIKSTERLRGMGFRVSAQLVQEILDDLQL